MASAAAVGSAAAAAAEADLARAIFRRRLRGRPAAGAAAVAGILLVESTVRDDGRKITRDARCCAAIDAHVVVRGQRHDVEVLAVVEERNGDCGGFVGRANAARAQKDDDDDDAAASSSRRP